MGKPRILEEYFHQWRDAKLALSEAKATEIKIRKYLCAAMAGGSENPAIYKREFDHFKVTATIKVTHKLDESLLNVIAEKLTEEDRDALTYKASLALKKYKKLPLDSILHEAVTVVPATPMLLVEDI